MPTGNSDRTLDLFFKVDAFTTSEAFFAGYGSFGSFNSTYALGALDDGRVFFSQWGDGIVGPSVAAGTWHNLAVTNVGGLATLYLDGVGVGSKNMNINTAAGTSFFIGRIAGLAGELAPARRLGRRGEALQPGPLRRSDPAPWRRSPSRLLWCLRLPQAVSWA